MCLPNPMENQQLTSVSGPAKQPLFPSCSARRAKSSFGVQASDVVKVDYPNCPSGVSACSPLDNPAVVRVTIFRDVATTLMQFAGAAATARIAVQATAAIIQEISPIPIIVLHPTLDGALTLNGTPVVKICGGPK